MWQSQQDVKDFMEQVKGLELLPRPGLPSSNVLELCESLMFEELNETATAMRIANNHAAEGPVRIDDMVEIADGLADLLYVTLYTANALGIDMEPLFDEVQRSNLSKKGGEKRADGKQLKPPGWSPPVLRPLLEAQLNQR